MPRYRFIASIILIIGLAAGLGAWETAQTFGINGAYYSADDKGGRPGSDPGWFLSPDYSVHEAEDSPEWLGGSYSAWDSDDEETRNLGNGWGGAELELYYRYRATTGFMQGEGALTKDNNLRFELKPVLSPVSLHLETEARWTPIAFLQFYAGFDFGTGWPLSFLGLHGLAMNDDDDITDTTVSGFAMFPQMGATFQFDLEALVPGKFNHIVISATAEAEYRYYSAAGSEEAWYWRADDGANFNAWQYNGDYALGWMPPWRVNFIGIIAEHEFWLSGSVRDLAPMDANPLTSETWGSDFHQWRFGPGVNVALKDNHGLTILLQFKNGLYYDESTSYARNFRLWEYAGDKYIKMERLALAYSWQID